MDQVLQTKKCIKFHQHPRKEEYVNKQQFCFGVQKYKRFLVRTLWSLGGRCVRSLHILPVQDFIVHAF